MPACSVDLGLDAALDAAVRGQWQALAEAGLPSLADHPGGSNAPHVTLAQRRSLPEPDDVLGLASALPVPLALTGLLVLPTRRGHVLARAITPSAPLLALHAAVVTALGPTPWPPAAHTEPGSWTPHVTLATGLDDDQVARALGVLPLGALEGDGVELRHWVPATRELTVSGRTGTMPPSEPAQAPPD